MGLKKLHHIVIGTPEVEATERFATDFGLRRTSRVGGRTYFKTCGTDSYSYVIEEASSASMLRVALEVESFDDLERAASLPGATAVTDIAAPGGGKVVSLTSPDGLVFDLVHGIPEDVAASTAPDLINNFGKEKLRRGVAQHTRPVAPAELFRFGHIGLFTTDVARMRAWLIDTLGFIPTDEMYIGDESNLICSFMRINRGDEWVDHHTIAVFKGAKADLHHASFEVADYEAQFMAHRYMETRGWELVWGVGRHPLGSHVFDLWRDPNRYRFETFSDTDLATAKTPTTAHDALRQEMDRWSLPGPPDRYFAH